MYIHSGSYLWYSWARGIGGQCYDIEASHSSKDKSNEHIDTVVEEVGAKVRVHPGYLGPLLPRCTFTVRRVDITLDVSECVKWEETTLQYICTCTCIHILRIIHMHSYNDYLHFVNAVLYCPAFIVALYSYSYRWVQHSIRTSCRFNMLLVIVMATQNITTALYSKHGSSIIEW